MKLKTATIAQMLLPVACIALLGILIGVVARSQVSKPTGANTSASLHGYRPFPANDAWNTPVDRVPIDPDSDVLIASIGRDKPLHPDFGTVYDGAPSGIPYIIATGSTPRVPVKFEYRDESDGGLYPIPPNAPIEGGPQGKGDRHLLILDRANHKLYELFSLFPPGKRREGEDEKAKSAGWRAGSGAIFDLNTNDPRPAGWTSADAAGLPIFPGLVRYDEVKEQKEIRHALRFTIVRSRHAYVPPARHFASPHTDPNLPPMGMRVRLKANVDISRFPADVQVILKCLKTYGMIVADNGSDWFLSGAPDARWNDEDLGTIKRIKGSDFEVIKMGSMTTR